jgi:hypothetical protein
LAQDIRESRTRQILFDEIRPVKLSNCRLERFGEAHDGGYLLCGNLLHSIGAGYSYGIGGFDGWGCDVSRLLHVTVHQYDCFDTRAPSCPGGNMMFHAECVSGLPATEQGRLFDTVESQLARNGDGDRRVVIKMDVEGDEWSSLAAAPDDLLQRIDQLVVEFHHMPGRSVAIVQRLKQFFHIAHVHFNNASCNRDLTPFPAQAYEVLFVNKQLAVVDATGRATANDAPDARNVWYLPDCQVNW